MIILFIISLYNMKFYTNTNYIYKLCNDGQYLYCATSGGLSIFSIDDRSFKVYTNTDGLPSNWSTCLAIDRDKNIWVGTDNGIGILKADHSSILRLSQKFFPSPRINAIHIREDTVYIGTEGGLLFINTRNTLIDTSDDEYKIIRTVNGLISDTVLSIVANRYIWVGTMNGITRFSKNFDSVTYFLDKQKIKTMVSKDSVNIYVGTDNALYLFRDDTFRILMSGWDINDLALKNDSLFIVIPNAFIIYKDSFMTRNTGLPAGIRLKSVATTSDAWAVGLGNEHSTFDNKGEGIGLWENGRFSTYKRECIPSNCIADLTVASNGQLFLALGPRGGIGAVLSGIALLKEDSSWLNITKPTIPTDMVHRCDADPAGRVWFIGNWEGGAFFYDTKGDSWVFFNSGNSQIGSNIGWDIKADVHNNIYFSLAGPADRIMVLDSSLTVWTQLNPGGLGHAAELEVADQGRIYVTFKTEGTLFIDTKNTIADVNDDTFCFYTEENGLPSINCQSVRVDPKGRTFIATEAGVALFYKDSIKTFSTKNSGMIYDDCLAMTIDGQKRIWILTSAGISIYNPYFNTWQRIGFSENNLTVKFAPEKLDNKAFLFDPYHNCVWLGSRSGLLRIDLTEPRVSGTDSAFVYPNPLTRNDHALVFKKIPPDAKIYIFSIDGRLIKKLEDFDPTVSGYIWFDAEINLTSGLYFALIKSPQEKRILKFAVVK